MDPKIGIQKVYDHKISVKKLNGICKKYFDFSCAQTDYDMVLHDLVYFSGTCYAWINIADHKKNKLITRGIFDPSGILKTFQDSMGFPETGKEWNLSYEETCSLKNTKKILINDIFKAAYQQILPGKIEIKELLEKHDIYQIVIHSNEKILGSVVLGWGKDEKPKDFECVELFINVLGIVLLRKKAEEELIENREEWQGLNEEIQAINEELEASLEQLTAAEEELRNQYDELGKQKQIVESLIEYSPDGIAVLDKHMCIFDMNQKFTEMFGYTLNECKGIHIDDLIASGNSIQLYCEARDITEMARKKEKIEFESLRIRKDGKMIPVAIRGGSTIVNDEILGYHAIYTDITERKRAEEKIKYLSYHDKLTGLYNRAYFEEKLNIFNDYKYWPVSIMVGDVNGLKLTNDVFGHLEGDKLLVKIAGILQEVCDKRGIVARWGGDEFAVILPNTDSPKMVDITAEIQKACQTSDIEPIKISIALGWATKSADIPIHEVIKEAEEKMYRHKLLEDKSTRSNIIASLQKSLSERSHETEAHGKQLNEMGLKLGKKIGLNNNELDELSLLSILHDIGKIAIPDHILTKPGKLTNEEWEEMRKHPEIGYRISKSSQELFHIADDILSHHERWDGKGYPQGLKGKEIPRLARILAIVDAYDAMTNSRVYKEAIDHWAAMEEIRLCSGSQFDPEMVEAFLAIMEEEKLD